MNLRFPDPMEPFKAIFSALLPGKELRDPSPRRQVLEYASDGQEFDIETLSSGEHEVVNVAFDFLLRRPEHCIVFFDEPELHLHPELSYRLLEVLQGIGSRNQFILSTHSPDIITASLDKSVVFLSPPLTDLKGDSLNQAVPVTEDDQTHRALKLLGQSIGIVALGRRIVLIEGERSSLDKEVYGALIKDRFPGMVLVPSGGKHTIQSFAAVQDAVLNQSIWGVQFFMICDGDSAPPAMAEEDSPSTRRLRVLSRYHLENYFLDEHVLSRVFKSAEGPGSWLRDPAQIRERLRELAATSISYSTALAIAAVMRQGVGGIDLMPDKCHSLGEKEVVRLLVERARQELERIDGVLNLDQVSALGSEYYQSLQASLDSDDDTWKTLIPGRQILARFASVAQIQLSRLKRSYIVECGSDPEGPFAEILQIFTSFAATEETA